MHNYWIVPDDTFCKRFLRYLTWGFFAVFLFRTGNAQEPSSPPISPLHETAQELQAIETGEMDDDVPAPAIELLPVFKHEIRDLFASLLQRAPDADATTLQKQVVTALSAAGVTLGDRLKGHEVYNEHDAVQHFVLTHPYGAIGDIVVRAPPGHNDLLVFTADLEISCGSDSVLYVFQKANGNWRRILDVESNGYKEVSGGLGMFDSKFGGGTAAGGWFLVTTDVNPWCSSNWQSLRWKVVRPGPGPEKPEVLMTASDGVYLGVDEPYRLSANEAGFELRFYSDELLDLGELVRPHVRNYSLVGRAFNRIAPVAFRPDHFVDEWSRMDEREAKEWTSPTVGSQTWKWHKLLRSPKRPRFGTSFSFVQPCPGGSHWQVGLAFEAYEGERLAAGVPQQLVFTVSKHKEGFLLSGVTSTRPPGCPGETAPPPQPPGLPPQ